MNVKAISKDITKRKFDDFEKYSVFKSLEELFNEKQRLIAHVNFLREVNLINTVVFNYYQSKIERIYAYRLFEFNQRDYKEHSLNFSDDFVNGNELYAISHNEESKHINKEMEKWKEKINSSILPVNLGKKEPNDLIVDKFYERNEVNEEI